MNYLPSQEGRSGRNDDMQSSGGEDLLLSRIIDRQASESDWQRFDDLEKANPQMAREVVRFLRADALLGLGLSERFQRASSGPVPCAVASSTGNLGDAETPSRAASLSTWSGWLTAAALALALIGTRIGEKTSRSPAPQVASSSSENSPSPTIDLLGENENSTERSANSNAHVIEELPLVVIDTRPASTGEGYEVTVLRQVLESRRVDNVLGVARDEEGRPSPVPIDPAVITPPAVL